MATQAELRHYLACWFQLGKSVRVQTINQSLCPAPVMSHGHYSQAFEACWQQCQAQGLAQCFLEGTAHSLEELLEARWDVSDCARCAMPVVQAVGGLTGLSCPCNDLPGWPNTELPAPRGEQDWRSQLQSLNRRLASAPPQLPPSPRPRLDDTAPMDDDLSFRS